VRSARLCGLLLTRLRATDAVSALRRIAGQSATDDINQVSTVRSTLSDAANPMVLDRGPGGADLSELRQRIAARFGLVPSFFMLASESPAIVGAMFGMAEFAYFDSPLPGLFKERLFTYVSRFCAVPYCMARHCGFLVGLGHVAGDRGTPSISVVQVLQMLERPFPDASARERLLGSLRAASGPLSEWPAPDSEIEQHVFDAAAVAFFDPVEARPYLPELQRLLGRIWYEYLALFLGFVRFAHFWTETHPELRFEADLDQLLAEQRTLAAWISGYQAIVGSELATRVTRDLHELEKLRRNVIALEADVSTLRTEVGVHAHAAAVSERTKVGFIATVSHELRTPLNAIIGYADLLQLGAAGPLTEQAAHYIDRIRITARHQRALIEDILSFSSLNANHETVTVAPVGLTEVCAEVTAVIAPLAEAKKLALVVNLPDSSLVVHTDPGKLRQILLNLLGNAVKFTETGRVTLTLGSSDGHLTAVVADTGPGIPLKDRDRIFDPFIQGDATHARAHGGTGLGLAIVQRLTQLLNGTLSLESVEGAGTTFTVVLPVT
jgi:signal transduction histidine kinase